MHTIKKIYYFRGVNLPMSGCVVASCSFRQVDFFYGSGYITLIIVCCVKYFKSETKNARFADQGLDTPNIVAALLPCYRLHREEFSTCTILDCFGQSPRNDATPKRYRKLPLPVIESRSPPVIRVFPFSSLRAVPLTSLRDVPLTSLRAGGEAIQKKISGASIMHRPFFPELPSTSPKLEGSPGHPTIWVISL